MTSVSASLNFIRRQDTKPYFHSARLTGQGVQFFFETEAREVRIDDLREIAETLSLDEHGFVLVQHETSVTDLNDDEAVRRVYYHELEALLRRRLAAVRSGRRGTEPRRSPSSRRPRSQRLHRR